MTPASPPPEHRSLRAAFRAQLWWSAKVLPVVGAALLAAILAETDPGAGLVRLAAMVVSAIGIAGGSHLVNDWADIEADALAGKANVASQLSTPVRAARLAVAVAIGVVPWVLTPHGPMVTVLVGVLLVVPVLYSVPPTRLKGRGLAGVAADATDAHVAPTLLAFAVMADAGTRTTAWTVGCIAAGIWAAGIGVRAILHHQLLDRANDDAAGVGTFVARHGAPAAVRLGRAAFVVELAGLAGLAAALAATAAWALLPFAAYAGVWWLDHRWEARRIEPVPLPGEEWMPLVEFYQVWPALLFGVVLVTEDLAWWPVPVAIVVLFAGAVAKQAGDLARMAASAWHDLAAASVKAAWWLRRRPIRWLRLSVYWPVHDWFAGIGHFRRRQARRIRRHWRTFRARRSA